MKINAMNFVKFVKDHATGSVNFVKVSVMDSEKSEDRDDGFVQSPRRKSVKVWRRKMG